MTAQRIDARAATEEWVGACNAALAGGDAAAVGALFAEGGWWRDMLVSQWDLQTVHGRDAIVEHLAPRLDRLGALRLEIDPTYEPFAVPGAWVQAILTFESPLGRGSGVVRLNPAESGGFEAWTFFVRLEELAGHEPTEGANRPHGVQHGGRREQVNWLDRRRKELAFEDAEPAVVIVGGGQSGLALAAELKQMGVSSLILERNARVGDNWRKRYRSLVLHDPVHSDHMPFLPFPSTWPVFMPKDKFGDWLETYASVLELNVWTSTEFEGARWDEAGNSWTVEVDRDGEKRTLRPHHVVLATGISGLPKMPTIPGESEFRGRVMHSSAFSDAADFQGQRVVIVGASNSAHDIAHDLAENGVAVTMVQRSATQVATSKHMFDVLFEGLYGEGANVRHGDLLASSFPLPVLFDLHRDVAFAEIQRRDADMIEGLKAAGFQFNPTGIQELFYQRGGGYYINVGAAEAIIDGRVRMRPGVEVERFTPTGVVYTDGTSEDADTVIFATGYGNVREVVGELFGEEVRERCTDVWGVDEGDEIRGVWRPTGQDGLWIMGGNLILVRQQARILALQLRAAESGLLAA
ncbi:MAG: NAD(P)/FAD-dependent oxidoreductase [Candidatus Leucobacter sulfamidivorax]|nr:NAD(P)/FAD-dependent oxidoreductase [Candidatus Leucobacter sulfamidivorax]